MSPTVRRALPRERSPVATTIAAAFAEDPAWAFILGAEYRRLAADFAGALFDVRVVSESVWVSDDLAAVAMWDPPKKNAGASVYEQSVWEGYRVSAGEDAFARLRTYNKAVLAAAPAERYWYLGVLATHPQRRREGLASAVLAPALEEAARAGIACCLETSTPENRRFYERRGFTQATDVALPGGPPTWWLRRPTAPPSRA
jgi:ribosomal protein S18 acetylase RimI-like enzyme